MREVARPPGQGTLPFNHAAMNPWSSRTDRHVRLSAVMHATSLSSPHHLVQPAEFILYSFLYSRIAVRHFRGWDPHVTQVQPPRPNCCTPHFICHIFSSDPPCKIEEVPAVDSIVLWVCSPIYSRARWTATLIPPQAQPSWPIRITTLSF